MNLRRDTMQSRLAISFSLVIGSILVVCFSLFYGYFSIYCNQTVAVAQGNLGSSVLDSIDTQIQQMNTVSMNLVYSNLVAENFRNYLAKWSEGAGTTAVWKDAAVIFNVLWAIIGPFQTVSQVNLYSPDGAVIGSGIFNNQGKVNLEDKSWYRPTMALGGSKYLGIPEIMPAIDVKNISLKDHRFIPLCRIFSSDHFITQGIVEVLQDTERIFAHTEDIRRMNPDLEIYALNSRGEQIYPDPDKQGRDGIYYRNWLADHHQLAWQSTQVPGPRHQADKVLTALHSELSDWDIVVVEPWAKVYAPLRQFTWLMLVSTIILILMGWLAAFLVARHLTVPLKVLQVALTGLNAADFIDPAAVPPALRSNRISEIDHLNYSFRSMFAKLRKSTTDLVTAHSEETKAQMLALQSLMNPHFIYNNLATISALADAGMTREISAVCNDISQILRYISNDSEQNVTIADEIEHTVKYLQCMKIAYGDQLSYQIDIPVELQAVTVPKLIIQPLAENAIKHGFNVPPPWRLELNGRVSGNDWWIDIVDNGIGFEPSAIELLDSRIAKWTETKRLPALGLEGMGLFNISLRMRLFFGAGSGFGIRSNPTGGSTVTIRGKIHVEPS